MSNLFNLSEHPAITEALNEAAKKLIEETAKAGYVNPELDCELKVDDGRIFKLKFERVDLN
jgi:hypothetical protein